jgi:hypothetical protein
LFFNGIFVAHNSNTYNNHHETNILSNNSFILSIHVGVVDRFGQDRDDDDNDDDDQDQYDDDDDVDNDDDDNDDNSDNDEVDEPLFDLFLFLFLFFLTEEEEQLLLSWLIIFVGFTNGE